LEKKNTMAAPYDQRYTRHITGGMMLDVVPGTDYLMASPTMPGSRLRWTIAVQMETVLSIVASGATGALLSLDDGIARASGSVGMWEMQTCMTDASGNAMSYGIQVDASGTLAYYCVDEVV
jgi:hypothetical protein